MRNKRRVDLIPKIFALVIRLEGLKRTLRAGWNIEFPEDAAFKTRRVPRPESVADHTWLLLMLALLIGYELNRQRKPKSKRPKLRLYRMIWMIGIHDVSELIVTDLVSATITDPIKLTAFKAAKHGLEDRAMRELFLPLGAFGRRCYKLWLEYEARSSPEAQIVAELDKFECALQAVLYREQGEQVSPEEFLLYADKHLKHPEIVRLMRLLRERVAVSAT